MAKSDARFEFKAKLGRTDHNLSQPFGFTCAAGMLLPIWYDIATPGDSYYMKHDLPLLRSVQFIAPSMVDVKVHFETFFVPFQMIYQPSENTLFSLQNLQSSFYDLSNLLNTAFPCWNYTDFVDAVLANYPDSIVRQDAFRLADLFALNPTNFLDLDNTSILPKKFAPSFFPFQLLAYHTIFQYYYRLDDKSNFNNALCNFDKFYGESVAEWLDIAFMNIHQRPWDFDYFTSIYRSPIVSDANMQRILPDDNYSGLINSMQIGINSNGNPVPVNSDVRSFSSFDSSVVGDSTAMIRQLFANEKLAMITGRTRKNYDSQVLAHFGVNVPHDVKHDLTMIHHDEYDLTVQEVTSLASTNDAALGELAGKSYSAGHGEQFKFTAPCHGVMMTIFSVEPKKRYLASFDRLNQLVDAYDIPTPEFDRLGNSPMYRYECGTPNYSSYTLQDLIGWKERFYAYKRKYPRVTYFAYQANGVNNFAAYYLASFPFGMSQFDNNSGVFGRTTYQESRPDLENRFYIERGSMDGLCGTPYYSGWYNDSDGENWSDSPWLVYARDPFIVNSHIKCKKVSWMSKDGEPIYNY